MEDINLEALRFQNIKLLYRNALQGPLSFRIKYRNICFLVSDDFYEKECLEEMLCGKLTFSDGNISIQEEPLKHVSVESKVNKEIVKQVSVISDTSRLFTQFSVAENIFYPHYVMRTSKAFRLTGAVLKSLDLEMNIKKPVKYLSNFERIIVEIIRAMSSSKKVLALINVLPRLTDVESGKLCNVLLFLKSVGYGICIIDSSQVLYKTEAELNEVYIINHLHTTNVFYSDQINSNLLLHYTRSYVKKQTATEDNSDTRYIHHNLELVYEKGQGITLSLTNSRLFMNIIDNNVSYQQIYQLLVRKYTEPQEIIIDSEKITPAQRDRLVKNGVFGVVDLNDLDNQLFNNISIFKNMLYPYCQKARALFMNRRRLRIIRKYLEDLNKNLNLNDYPTILSSDQIFQVLLCKYAIYRVKILFIFLPAYFTSSAFSEEILTLLKVIMRKGTTIVVFREKYPLEIPQLVDSLSRVN